MAISDQTMIHIEPAQRVQHLPPYLFVEMDRAKRKLTAAGHDVIDLGVGDPDLATPPSIVERLKSAVDDPANHHYSITEGMRHLRAAIAAWYARRFQVTLNPETEILPLLGSKEGIGHLPLAMVNPGEVVLVPEPCYPPYRDGALLAGAEVVSLPLVESRGFFPELGAITAKVAQRAKLLFLNYPNNPTAAVASLAQFEQVIEFSRTHGVAVAHDAAYSEIAFDKTVPPSFLQHPDAKAVGVEFHSLSKTFNMTGWRVGWVCGNARIIGALAKLKNSLDSGIFQPVQWAGVAALTSDPSMVQDTVAIYQARRDLFIEGLAKAGWTIPKPSATFFLWARVPTQESSMDFTKRILDRAHVVITPGVGFGRPGEGYVRLSLTLPTERIQEAITRLGKAL